MDNKKQINGNKPQRPSLIIFDRKGGDYVPEELGPDCLHVGVWDALKLGLNAPLGIAWNTWIPIVCSLFCCRARIINGWTPLVAITAWLVEALNPDCSTLRLWPDFRLILDTAYASPSSSIWGGGKGEYLATVCNQLEAVVRGE